MLRRPDRLNLPTAVATTTDVRKDVDRKAPHTSSSVGSSTGCLTLSSYGTSGSAPPQVTHSSCHSSSMVMRWWGSGSRRRRRTCCSGVERLAGISGAAWRIASKSSIMLPEATVKGWRPTTRQYSVTPGQCSGARQPGWRISGRPRLTHGPQITGKPVDFDRRIKVTQFGR